MINMHESLNLKQWPGSQVPNFLYFLYSWFQKTSEIYLLHETEQNI